MPKSVLIIVPFFLLAPCVAWFGPLPSDLVLRTAHSDELGRKALREYPWYDSGRDKLKKIPVGRGRSNSNRSSGSGEGGSGSGSGEGGSGSGSGGGDSSGESRRAEQSESSFELTGGGALLEILVWTIVIVGVAALIYLLVKAFLDREQVDPKDKKIVDDEDSKSDDDRRQELPFAVNPTKGDFLSSAGEAYRKGEFREAIIFLYSHILIHLDKHQFLVLEKGKTNRGYLSEVRRADQSGVTAEIMNQTMVAFEDVFFGNHQLDRQQFESCWNRMDEFHRQVGAT